MRTGPLLAILFLTACAGAPTARGPAAAVSPGGLNEEEQKACDEADGECRYLIAPCTRKEHMSLKQETYLNDLEDFRKRGYCQITPRPLPAEMYNKDTCIYVFVKNGTCRPQT